MFSCDTQRAKVYAAHKFLERMSKEDGELPPGFSLDISGQSLTITFPPNTVVSRSTGEDGLGHLWHKASQNLNGFAVIAVMIFTLRKFNQAGWIIREILSAIRKAIKTKTLSTEDKLIQQDTLTVEELEKFKSELQADMPKRKQDTVRDITYGKLPPTIIFHPIAKVA